MGPLGEEPSAQLITSVTSAMASLECVAAGTLGASPGVEAPFTIVVAAGTVQAGIIGTRRTPLRPKEVLIWRSPARPMQRIRSRRLRAGRIPHHWRHPPLGEEPSAQLITSVTSAMASLECVAAGTLGATPGAEVRFTIAAAAGADEVDVKSRPTR